MKSFLAACSLIFAQAWIGAGQGISVQLLLDQEQYLPGEELVAKVRITNDSGQNVPFGADESWLTFTVEDSNRLAVTKRGSLAVKGEFSLEPSTTGTKKVEIANAYDLSRIGRYFISATVLLPQWGKALQTKPVTFDIIKGSSLWEKEFGVPTAQVQADSPPEIRQYALIQTLHSKSLKLYFRLTDARDANTLRIYSLGPMVSFSNLEPQLDKFSNLHILYQTGGRVFTHCLINPDGVLIARETYEHTETRPTLRAEKDGRISVVGGVRSFSPNDLPPTVSLNSTGDGTNRKP